MSQFRSARLRCEPLEDRLTPAFLAAQEASLVASAAQLAGGDTVVRVGTATPFAGAPVAPVAQFVPFVGYAGPVFVARGDVTGDGLGDVVASAAAGGHVRVFDGQTGAVVRSFFPYPGFNGEVRVAAGDVLLNGRAEVVTAAAVNGHVKVFDGFSGVQVSSFLTSQGFTGPVSVAVPRVSAGVPPGRPVVLTGAQGQVRAFAPLTGAPVAVVAGAAATGFVPFVGYAGPVFVAVGDVNADGVPDVLTGAENGHVRSFDGVTGAVRGNFFTVGPGQNVIAIAAADANARTVNGLPVFDVVVGSQTLAAFNAQTGFSFPTNSGAGAAAGFVFVG